MTLPIDLRCGDWRDVLANVSEVDAVISDPPYSPRVHDGFRSGSDYIPTSGRSDGWTNGDIALGGLPYEPLTPTMAAAVVERFADSASWMVFFGDHITNGWWADAMDAAGWYVFAPVIWHRTGGSPRFQGDGPSNEHEYIAIGRPKRSTKCGSLPGSYVGPNQKGNQHDTVLKGQKPLWLMRAVVGDYTLPGQTVVDPFSGSGSTLIAAAELGCTAIGAELDPDTYAKAQKRIAKGYTPLPHPRAHRVKGKATQGALW